MSIEINQELINILKKRFEKHAYRHPGVTWDDVLHVISQNDQLLKALEHMENTGGEPDVMTYQNHIIYVDFSKETPKGRTSTCYDEEARLSRKKFPPETSAMFMAEKMGITLCDEQMYQAIQHIEPLDLKTSSWILTPQKERELGGALFGDRRYDRTFIYHNGADSYYGVRGFRGYIIIK